MRGVFEGAEGEGCRGERVGLRDAEAEGEWHGYVVRIGFFVAAIRKSRKCRFRSVIYISKRRVEGGSLEL